MTMATPFLSLALPRRAAPTTPPRRGSTYPLTPSKVTPAAAVSSAYASRRPELDCYGVSHGLAASTLLSRVASSRRHSTTAKEDVQMVAPSPDVKSSAGEEDMVEEPYLMLDSASDGSLRWDDVIRCWPGNDNRGTLPRISSTVRRLTLIDGYISFPDFERYSQSSEDGGDREPERDAAQSPRT